MQDITFTDRVIVEAFLALFAAAPIKIVLALTSALVITRHSDRTCVLTLAGWNENMAVYRKATIFRNVAPYRLVAVQ
jgi:hypothetical protein